MNKIFLDFVRKHYLYWQSEDKKAVRKINELIHTIERHGNFVLGEPEPLKHELSDCWSRRISDEHRLIYSLDEENIYIAGCKSHS